MEVCGRLSYKLWTYFVPAGHGGIGINAISYAGIIKISMTVDDAIMNNPQDLMYLIE